MPNLRVPLFLTRLSIFYFLLPWQVMRFTNPDQIDTIAKTYYHADGGVPGLASQIFGAAVIVLLLLFLVGFAKRWTYLAVLVIHAGAILISVQAYIWGLDSFRLIFLAAIPAAFAMGLLYALRDHDTLFSVDDRKT